MKTTKFIIITSINELNQVMLRYASLSDWQLVLVGDRKGPADIRDDRIIFLGLEEQRKLGFSYFEHCPENHYARKNLGYLFAMANGAELIAETDDDNLPYEEWGEAVSFEGEALEVFRTPNFMNVYSEFTAEPDVWPRGFPLQYILDDQKPTATIQEPTIAVWQHLADGNPDVDAIFRLTRRFSPFRFRERKSFALDKHVYCPFNSQNTFWSQQAFPLLYLPSSVSFRFTDILRGYVAQRAFWEKDLLLGFGKASVFQERNQHDLFGDFVDEYPMYSSILEIVETMEGLVLNESFSESLEIIYRSMNEMRFVSGDELRAIEAWNSDLRSLGIE